MNEPRELVRYHIYERGYGDDARPALEEERWVKTAKIARKRESSYGQNWSNHSHAELEARAKTPEEALEQYRAQKQKAYDIRVKDLERARQHLEVAQRASIVDGKLVRG